MGRPRRMVVAWSSLLRTADEEALLSDGRFPDDVIGLAVEALHEDRVDVVTEVFERFDESGGEFSSSLILMPRPAPAAAGDLLLPIPRRTR